MGRRGYPAEFRRRVLEVLNLVAGRLAQRIAGETLFTRLEKVLAPAVVEVIRYPLAAA